MGNIIGLGKTATVINVSGKDFKVKIPATANDIIKDHYRHILLDFNEYKYRTGLRTTPLEPHQELQPNKVYVLVRLPRFLTLPRGRMIAEDRLEVSIPGKFSAPDLTPYLKLNIKLNIRVPEDQWDKLMEAHNKGEPDVVVRLLCGRMNHVKEDVKEDDEEGLVIYPYERLKITSSDPATNIDVTKREAYLSSVEFKEIFGMSKDMFYKLLKWKQNKLKMAVQLF